MGDLLQELVRRNVIRVAAVYIIVGWLLRQASNFMVPALSLPEVFNDIVMVLIFLGLPVTLYLAWVYELTATGLKKTPPRDPEAVHEKYVFNRLDYVLTAGTAFVLMIIGLDTFAPASNPPAKTVTTALEESITEPAESTARTSEGDPSNAVSSTAFTAPPNSIAVMPFDDLSVEMNQTYFSDGISEEILNALVKIDGLRVPARTSSFAFKGRSDDPQMIGTSLNVAHILTGSIRKQANQVRISVQLINTNDGFQEWGKAYNGTLDDVFDLQESIAIDVASEMQVVLTGEDARQLAARPTENQEAYDHFIRAQTFVAARIGDNLPKAIESYEKAVALDPNFARTWSGLAVAHALSPQYRLVDFEPEETAAEINARRALLLDPSLAEPYAVLGWVYMQRRDYLAMHEQFEKALARDPKHVNANLWYGIGLVAVGHLEAADRQFTRVKELDPVSLVGLHMYSLLKWMIGNTAEAEIYATRVAQLGFPSASIQLAEIAGQRGENEQATSLFEIAVRGMATRFSKEERDIFSTGVYGSEADRAQALTFLDTYLAAPGKKAEQVVPYFLLRVGNTEQAFSVYEANQVTFDPLIYFVLWGPYGEEARKSDLFKGFAERVGLMAYWQQHGWPDLCEASTAQQLTCS